MHVPRKWWLASTHACYYLNTMGVYVGENVPGMVTNDGEVLGPPPVIIKRLSAATWLGPIPSYSGLPRHGLR
jgi:hypothetical protein